MQRNHPAPMTIAAPADQHPPALTPWELAEAEAEADVIDADLESCGAGAPHPAAVAPRLVIARATDITEVELAEAECEADLCHVDGAA